MFTGLVEEVGSLQTINRQGESLVLTIRAKRVLEGVCLGDSISVNGACLTVIRFDTHTVSMDVTPETFRRTTLNRLVPGERVNLERAMQATARFGGHIVQGHVDGIGFIRNREVQVNAVYFTVEPQDPSLFRYMIPKGSVAIDGISLTVVDTEGLCFRVSIIPHTLADTALQYKRPGDSVNLETDVIGKYVEHLLSWNAMDETGSRPVKRSSGSRLSEAFLKENGFL
ncbi:riboflavin synthase [Paenibacillus agricola]|uniref:Riboflavin synthase n=1 Tax=Paenibacillus agricola TaxID=2716264 RepID=A0ABX0J0A1_9BACL|nr:riboflavin synthase [Paenibacillus agricola]NHN28885.1 riboflavin synthase [Paenibacillus agricola]